MGAADREREAIKNAYPNSQKWTEKVNKMSNDQVIAIFKRLQSVRKLGK